MSYEYSDLIHNAMFSLKNFLKSYFYLPQLFLVAFPRPSDDVDVKRSKSHSSFRKFQGTL